MTAPDQDLPDRDVEQSAARTPLVLLPGTLCDDRVFAPLVAGLQRRDPGRRIVVQSTTGAPSIRALASTALQAAPDRFALLGFSLGGIVALEMVAQAPHRIAGLALVASNARPVAAEAHADRRASLDLARTLGAKAYAEAHLWPTYVSPAAVRADALKDLIGQMAHALGLETLADQVEAAIGRSDSRPRLAAIAAPTLLLCGADDGVCTVEMHEEMARAIPAAALAVVANAGHLVLLEAPERAAREVATWLARVDAAPHVSWAHSSRKAAGSK